MDLKLQGYSSEYPPTALAVDTTDFIASHVLIAQEEEDGDLSLLMGYKWVTSDLCSHYKIDFPPLAAAKSACASRHEKRLRQLLSDYERKGKRVGYIGSWTSRPDVRADRDAARHLVQIAIGMHARFAQDHAFDGCIALGVPRLKTERIEASAGYELLTDEEGPLPPFPLGNLAGEPVILMHLQEHSATAQSLANEHESLWRQRLSLEQE
ncbi:hypothetical protein IC614_09720 [Allosphingosinicella flava]|uniref:Uncharacterized protein n=1 Tax=Allosphingosinicella flava TaxID=2771430 RepID=A0A7T2GIN7_9SPHN|nr:hypothetical protein IC614_09720 [Sphingosinicella flava]